MNHTIHDKQSAMNNPIRDKQSAMNNPIREQDARTTGIGKCGKNCSVSVPLTAGILRGWEMLHQL
jgi:hypothetical protein